eukprot:CAMPEP_0203856256 /NCGR_PEP_ID=MMETSP0359-20131031/10074_1 /ASSEMBLY_ACC=CAM_ASM_000338 /TAXON_ID=268821 /ORGANISM="Scrippsiella Hangoei, Strain SHTV-5" /LENGTH=156 /DNA_ID=CAMNT_0050772849 /DNA_START=720 /DNA_END=1190 /DNA_ORIENTATION=+
MYNVVDQENLSDGSWYDRPEDSALPFAARRCPRGDALETLWVSTMASTESETRRTSVRRPLRRRRSLWQVRHVRNDARTKLMYVSALLAVHRARQCIEDVMVVLSDAVGGLPRVRDGRGGVSQVLTSDSSHSSHSSRRNTSSTHCGGAVVGGLGCA